MSKININIDTDPNNRGFNITLNGQTISNAQEVSTYQELDEDGKIDYVGVSIRVFERVDDNTVKNISYYSYGSVEAKAIQESDIKTYSNIEGFIGKEEKNTVFEDIDKFFQKKY